jgi:YidC/Oxa1 family membrane protein insertase
MQKMQQQMKTIQPEMDALRAKLKDNPQKLNKEIMELYRKRGVNPLASCQSGCLPMLLQMPVFFALYGVLYNSIELRGAPFLGWITDLSAKDPYYILPVLMGASMFVQQKLTGMGVASGPQQEQAKMMTMLMPVFLTWIFASLPSGVVLYWFVFNIATALQQLLIRKKQAEVAAA